MTQSSTKKSRPSQARSNKASKAPKATKAATVKPAKTKTDAAPTAPKKRRTGLIVGVVIAIILALGLGGTALGYFLWYQHPDKVVADALTSLNKGTDNNGLQATVTVDGGESGRLEAKLVGRRATNDRQAATVDFKVDDKNAPGSAKLEAILDQQTAYLKLHQATFPRLPSLQEGGMPALGLATTAAFSERLQGRWLRFDGAGSGALASLSAEPRCLLQEGIALGNNQQAQQDLAQHYRQHNFLKVKQALPDRQINGVDSIGHKVTVEVAKLRTFIKELAQTSYGQKLADCGVKDWQKLADQLVPQTSRDFDIDVYASRFGHHLTELSLQHTHEKDGSKLSVVVQPTRGQAEQIDIPNNAEHGDSAVQQATQQAVAETLGIDPALLGSNSHSLQAL